jgi:hypothetical protein
MRRNSERPTPILRCSERARIEYATVCTVLDARGDSALANDALRILDSDPEAFSKEFWKAWEHLGEVPESEWPKLCAPHRHS